MTVMHVDRLTLHLPGMSEWEARRLAQLVAQGLGGAALPADMPRRMDALRTEIAAQPGEATERLAHRIVEALVRQVGDTA
jgi:hypothetical protein